MKQIKPCPFCGSEKVNVGTHGNNLYVCCYGCNSCGPYGISEEEAIKLWNAAPRKEDVEMGKSCANCVHISKEVDGKVYCTEEVDADYSCKYWETVNPFESSPRLCWNCKYSYIDDETVMYYCGRAIGNPEGYVCDKWSWDEDEKEPKSTPLNSENSSVKPFINGAKEELIGIRIREPFFNVIQQLAEEAAELTQAALKYGRTKGMGSYTKVNPKDARDFMIEEFADVLLCMEAAFPHCSESTDFYSKLERTYCEKAKRWLKRLKAHEE